MSAGDKVGVEVGKGVNSASKVGVVGVYIQHMKWRNDDACCIRVCVSPCVWEGKREWSDGSSFS